MKITFIGTGSIIPDPKKENTSFRSYSAIYIELKNKITLLFDIGPGTLTKLQQIGIDTRVHPDHLFITHFHIDHCQDYVALTKGRYFHPLTGEMNPQKKLMVHGPEYLRRFSDELFGKVERWSYMTSLTDYRKVLTLNEVTSGEVWRMNDWDVTCLPVDHYDGVAFRLNAEGKSFVYSGDMGYDENISILGKDADLVAIECSFPNKSMLNGKHLCPEDVGLLAQKGNFKQTVLTHMYPACAGKEAAMEKTIESLASTNVSIANDFLTVEL